LIDRGGALHDAPVGGVEHVEADVVLDDLRD
jgi:hypothetical protein